MSKRNLFAEISEGMGALQAEREGRLTLRRVPLSGAVAPDVDGAEVRVLRNHAICNHHTTGVTSPQAPPQLAP